MWRYRFLNLCFVILAITFLALQYSDAVFGPRAHTIAVTDSDSSQGSDFITAGQSSSRLRALAELSRGGAFLHDIWLRGMAIREWLMEYNTFRWEIFSASSPAETELLEARFHVANAEVFLEATHENDRAIKELARAETSLQAVQTLVQPRLVPQLTIIKDEIVVVETRRQTEETFSTMPFQTIKADLDRLIEIVRSAQISEESNHAVSTQG
jgi:hypothetical protein